MDIQISDADPDDAAAILELQRLAYRIEAERYDDFSIPPLTQTLQGIKSNFVTHLVLKAEVDGELAGSVRGSRSGDTCHVGRLVVHPGLQDRGIGTALMLAIEDRFRGASRFELFTGHLSQKNIHLYESLGYRIFRTEKVHERLDLVYMEKSTAQG